MGDRSHVKLYSELLAFLEEHGRSLIEYGSAERGLAAGDAHAFVELLQTNHVPLLGIELWRATDGGLELDIQEIWYSSHADVTARYPDAWRYFNRVETGQGDVFADQFG